MTKEVEKNYIIPRIDGENTDKRKWALLKHSEDKWHWVVLDRTMEAHIVTAANFADAVEALMMELIDKA